MTLCTAYRNSMLSRVSLRQIGEVTGEQITLAQARTQLRLDAYGSPEAHPDDEWIETIGIPSAREWCETQLARALAPSVYELYLGAFPCADLFTQCYTFIGYGETGIKLPMAPVAGIVSVIYVDGDGVTQTMDAADYSADVMAEPGWLYPAASWPSTSSVPNAVTVRYNAGYTLPTDSPDDRPLPNAYRMAMLLVLGHLYENRENTTDLKLDELPLGARTFLKNSLRIPFA